VRSVVCRDEIEITSVWARDVVVSTEELLCFLTSRGLNKLETLEVDEMTLEVSDSRGLPARRRLVARRKKLATPEVAELLELREGERWRSTWKLDKGRDVAVIIGQGKRRVDESRIFAHVCFPELSRSHANLVERWGQQEFLSAQPCCWRIFQINSVAVDSTRRH
jgi:hypothetical protein